MRGLNGVMTRPGRTLIGADLALGAGAGNGVVGRGGTEARKLQPEPWRAAASGRPTAEPASPWAAVAPPRSAPPHERI